ncbi:unnamed protein product [Ranitomeya imitator]|uniref:ribonuclease H n=1 Tax=Ranitomeya imitator TaxID=111125 RepID=A0ABN9L5E0_9NEOB|nr:unnamed protein product [Ranitomeya imitator]
MPEGHFEYLVMPFGLSNAPSVFQSFMHDIFREYLDKFLIVYLDDILVFSDDWESHVKQGIYDWTQPTSLKSLQKFLGFANFYRRFIANFSSIAKPLTDLTKKGADVVNWSSAAVEAFQELKGRFSSAPVLCQPDVSLPFQVEVDASEIGAGAVLSQRSSDCSVMKPCAFFSRKFSPAERNYDVGNRELLAMKWAFEEWRHWLEGAKHRVVVLTDHKNLTYLESAKRLNPRQARWSLFFSRFDFVVSYLPGSKNVKADALSRSFVPDSPGLPKPAGILKEGLYVLNLSKKYGPIYTIQLGEEKVVVLCGYEAVKDALVNHADEFLGRPKVPLFLEISKGHGIIFAHYEIWKVMRRFTLSTLRDFGMGKEAIEHKISEETRRCRFRQQDKDNGGTCAPQCVFKKMLPESAPPQSALSGAIFLKAQDKENGGTCALQVCLQENGAGKRELRRHRFRQQEDEENGEPFDNTMIINAATANIIVSILLSNRFDYEDPTLLKLIKIVNESMHLIGTPMAMLYNAFPTVMSWCSTVHKTVMENVNELHAFIRETFTNQKKELDVNDQRNLIDSFLVKQKEVQKCEMN